MNALSWKRGTSTKQPPSAKTSSLLLSRVARPWGCADLSPLPDSEAACAISSVSNRCDKQPASIPTSTDHQPHPSYPAQKCKYDPASRKLPGSFSRRAEGSFCVCLCVFFFVGVSSPVLLSDGSCFALFLLSFASGGHRKPQ